MTQTPNIAHCIHGLGLGGAQQVIRSLVETRHQQPGRYYVYCCLDGPVRKQVEAAGAQVRILARHLPKFDPVWVLRLARAFRRDRIDLVHTHLFGDSLHGYLAARLAGPLPVVMTIHNELEAFSRLQRRAYRWLIPRCTRTIACSASALRSFQSTGWPGTEAMETIPNGIEVPRSRPAGIDSHQDLRSELGLEPGRPLLAAVGRLATEKGYRFLIGAFARLLRNVPNPPFLVFLGEGHLREELERQARTEGVQHSVRFLGFRRGIVDILPAVDIVVFSSLHEGLPLVLLEAMATARCIVGTSIPGLLNAVTDGRDALLVPPGDVDRLAAALSTAVSDTALRERLGEAAREKFLARFTVDRMIEGYDAMHREALRSVSPTLAQEVHSPPGIDK